MIEMGVSTLAAPEDTMCICPKSSADWWENSAEVLLLNQVQK